MRWASERSLYMWGSAAEQGVSLQDVRDFIRTGGQKLCNTSHLPETGK